MSSPEATIVILVNLGSAVTPAVILSMLYPLRENSPEILERTPDVLSTINWNTFFCMIFLLLTKAQYLKIITL
jgi:hypothetical protein